MLGERCGDLGITRRKLRHECEELFKLLLLVLGEAQCPGTRLACAFYLLSDARGVNAAQTFVVVPLGKELFRIGARIALQQIL